MHKKILTLFFIFIFLIFNCARAQPINYNVLLLDVKLNGEELNEVDTFLQLSNGEVFVKQAQLTEWHLMLPKLPPVNYQGDDYYPLNAYPGITYKINMQKMVIEINTPPESFLPNKIDASAQLPVFQNYPKPPLGGFFNYDTNAQTAANQSEIGGIFTAGIFDSFGVITSNFLAQRTTGVDEDFQDTVINNQVENQFVRLNTTWTIDQPDVMQSIRFGDDYNAPGMWGRSVGFGGVQWTTNFGTQPTFIAFPLPSASGEAVVPSVVDLYVNNALVAQRNVPAGPFSINSIPVVTGQGNVNIVTTDLLGRQQIVTLPYYNTNVLLKPGLQNFSYEAGFIRNDYGIESDDYSKFMATGTDSIGITDDFTGQWHAEGLQHQQTLGIGGNYLWAPVGVFNLAVAGSHSTIESDSPDPGTGGLVQLGYQHQSAYDINYGVNAQFSTRKFDQVGIEPDELAPASLTQAFMGIPVGNGGSIGMSYTEQANRSEPNVSLFNISYNKNLFWHWTVSLTGLTNVGGQNNKAVFITLTRNVDDQTTLNLNGIAQQDTGASNQGSVQLLRNLPVGDGYGYNVIAAGGQQQNYQASFSAQDNYGTYTVGAANQEGNQGYQAQVSGGVAVLGDNAYLTREITNSFAVVQVPGYSNVGVYSYNQLIGHTNSDGNLLIPNLLPYQSNTVKIDPNDLPLNAQIDQTQLEAVPYFDSGVLLRFPVRPANAATVTVMQSNGKSVPAGATAIILGQNNSYPVADDGELYLTGLLPRNNQIQITWDHTICSFTIDYPVSTTAPIPNLGTVICKEVISN